MGQRALEEFKAGRREGVIVTHRVVLGATGAISSQDSQRSSLCQAVKTAAKTGRYTFTFDPRVARVHFVGATVIGATDAAYTNTAGGSGATFSRNNAPTTRTVDIQFTRNDTSADAEITDNFTFEATFVLYLA